MQAQTIIVDIASKMIHLITKGGLGNQMFEYAYAIKMQQAYGDKRIYISGIYNLIAKDKRPIALQHFRLAENACIISTGKAIFFLIHLFIQIIHACGFSEFIRILRAKLTTEKSDEAKLRKHGTYCAAGIFSCPELEPCNSRIKHAYGNFQGKNALSGIEHILRRHFQVSTTPTSANSSMLNEIQNSNAVCVHIRRGDYLLSKYAQLQVCDEQYYATAIAQAREILLDPVFFIFSTGHDDIEWVRQNYHLGDNVRYVDLDNPDYEELRLMYTCKHFIISNSTFSWWAAVLSQESPEKKVWCPSVWIKGSEVTLAQDSWILI